MGEMGGWAKNKYLRGNASHDMRSSCAAHMHSCRQRLAGSPTNALEESRSPSFSATSRQTCVGDSRLLWWAIGVRWRSLAVRLRSGQSFGECGLLEGGLRCLSVSCCYSRVWAALLEHASNRSCACVCVSLSSLCMPFAALACQSAERDAAMRQVAASLTMLIGSRCNATAAIGRSSKTAMCSSMARATPAALWTEERGICGIDDRSCSRVLFFGRRTFRRTDCRSHTHS